MRNYQVKSRERQESLWSDGPFFFDGPTIDVAQRLVGAYLIRRIPSDAPDGGTVLVVRIVETEAYLPLVDPSCHAYRGPTRRNASAFGRAGTAYVYFIYGNHFCLNVATERAGIGAAVLIRAAEPVRGIDAMRRRRPKAPDERLTSGPGNLCRALSIDRADDGADLRAGDLRIAAAARNATRLVAGPRIGLSTAREWPLRFFDPESRAVSAHRIGYAIRKGAVHLVDGRARSVV